jgi:hypothetical protein
VGGAGAMEDRRAIAGIMIHPDVGLDIMMAKGARWDLQSHTLVSDGVVRSDDPVFLDAKNIGDIDTLGDDERRGLKLRLYLKMRIVAHGTALVQIVIRRLLPMILLASQR